MDFVRMNACYLYSRGGYHYIREAEVATVPASYVWGP